MTPTSPSESAALPSTPTSTKKTLKWWALSNFAVLLIVGTALGVSEIRLRERAEIERLANERAARLAEEQIRELREIQLSIMAIEPMQPPSNDKIFSNLGKGMGVTENVVRTGQVGTTAQSAFVTDLTSGQQSDAWTQEIIIRNRDDATGPTQNLCFHPIAWASAGANCNAKCVAAAATMTCPAVGGAGAATDGSLVPAGSASHRRYDGTSCICIVASAAGTDYQTERVVR